MNSLSLLHSLSLSTCECFYNLNTCVYHCGLSLYLLLLNHLLCYTLLTFHLFLSTLDLSIHLACACTLCQCSVYIAVGRNLNFKVHYQEVFIVLQQVLGVSCLLYLLTALLPPAVSNVLSPVT